MDWWSSCNERGALPRGRLERDVLAESLDREQPIEFERDPAFEMARDSSFNAADLIQISDDALADAALGGSREGDAARRNIDGLARIFASIFEHIAARQNHFDALMTTALLDLGLYQRHRAGVHVCAFPNRLNIVVLSLAQRPYCLLG